MTRARILLPAMMLMTSCICAMAQQSDLFSHKRINLYGMKAMPHSTGNDHRDSIARNRIWRAEQPRLYEYLPGFVHSKTFVSDDEKAVVGSINLDFRSLFLHFECGVYIYENPVIAAIRKEVL